MFPVRGVLSTNIAAVMVGEAVDDDSYDVVLLIGQSNMVGYAVDDLDPVNLGNADIQQYALYGPNANTVVQADEPLLHPTGENQFSVLGEHVMGLGVAFAKAYIADGALSAGRKILLVPAAEGATELTGAGGWGPGEYCLTRAIAAANAAMAVGPSPSFKGCIWLQGEGDATNNISRGDYAYVLDELIATIRSEVTGASDSWFLVHQMVPEYIADQGAQFEEIDIAHQNTPYRVLKSAFVAANTPNDVNVHFRDPDIMRANGASAYAEIANISVSTVLPGQVTGLEATGETLDQVSLSWTAPNSDTSALPTEYSIQYRVNGDTDWIEFPRLPATITTCNVTGLSAATLYDFRVAAKSTPGTGTYSSTLTHGTTGAVSGNDIQWGSGNSIEWGSGNAIQWGA